MPDFPAEAAKLAAQGYYVFPLIPNGKKPALKGWQEASTRDPTAIAGLWSYCGVDCNIGIDTDKSGLVVVDLDGVAGKTSWHLYSVVHGKHAPTRIHKTARGGEHWLYRQPSDIGGSPLAKSIDIRGKGGLIVAPGSVIDGREYTVHDASSIALLPEWARTVLEGKRREKREAQPTVDGADEPVNVDRYKAILQHAYDTEGPWGEDDPPDTYPLAAKGRDRGLSLDTVFTMMADYLPSNEHGWLYKCVENAFNYAQNDQGCDAIEPGSKVHGNLPSVLAIAAEQAADRLWRMSDLVLSKPVTFWDADRLLPRVPEGVAIWFGPKGGHKTNVILSKIFEILLAQAEARVLYLCGEGRPGLGARLNAHCVAGGIDPASLDERFAAHYVPLMHDENQVQGILDKLDHEAFRPSLVIMDTLATATAGLDQDNKTAGIFTRQGAIGKFSAKLGALVLLIGHTGKDERAGLLGAQGQSNNVDAVIAHKADRGDNARAVKLSTWESDGGKQRDGPVSKAWYAIDEVIGIPVPRRIDHRTYTRLTGKEADFGIEELTHALRAANSPGGIASKVLCAYMWPADHGEAPEPHDAFLNKMAAQLDRRAADHTSINNILQGGGRTTPLSWALI